MVHILRKHSVPDAHDCVVMMQEGMQRCRIVGERLWMWQLHETRTMQRMRFQEAHPHPRGRSPEQ